MKLNLTISLAAAAALLVGCRESDQRVPKADTPGGSNLERDVRTSASEVGASFEEQKRRAEAKWSEQLKELDGKMAEMKTKAQTAGDKAKSEWEVQRPKLEAQRAEASRRLDEIKSSSKETWSEVSAKSEAAFSELQKGFKEAWAKLTE